MTVYGAVYMAAVLIVKRLYLSLAGCGDAAGRDSLLMMCCRRTLPNADGRGEVLTDVQRLLRAVTAQQKCEAFPIRARIEG